MAVDKRDRFHYSPYLVERHKVLNTKQEKSKMRSVSIDESEIPETSAKPASATYQFVHEFLESDDTVREVVPDDGEKIEGIRTSLASFADRHKLSVKLMSRNGRLFIQKVSDAEAAENRAKRAAKRLAKAQADAEANGTAGD